MNNRIHLLQLAIPTIILMTQCTTGNDQESGTGQFLDHTDVGEVLHEGGISYDPGKQTYTITGSGANMWGGEDQFQFLWKPLKGNFIVRAEVAFIGEGGDPHRKIGWMVRNSLATNSAHVNACRHGDGLTSLQFRKAKGKDTEEIRSSDSLPDVIQLERRDSTYIMSTARHGKPLQEVRLTGVELKDEVLVGLYACAHNADTIVKASFRNVRIIRPAAADFVPYRDYIGSNMEIMDVASRNRTILFSTPHSIQAPNWTRDGRSLIYNSNGLLWTYDLEQGHIARINTGFADGNNNDHVLSFDGQTLGISHHNPDNGWNSTVYVLPLTGSDAPEQITTKGTSYLHGWSPDKKYLVFTGLRNDQYDIYRISLEGREEERLTNAEGLDDGPEVAPDGQHIYFNSNRTGTMQLWRMNADGSGQEQLTFDAWNDWFPHVSPDNKWIVFISFPEEVSPDDHPFYKHVMIRLMPADGGEPEVIAYVYGGQGSMNVPDWSPDGKKIAFVSNTGGF